MTRKILLQTTIPSTLDDWSIARFGLLAEFLDGLRAEDGSRLYSVTARDREANSRLDPVLSQMDGSEYDQLWLFAVDTGTGLLPEECDAIGRFRARGRGLLVTRDHMDLGSSVCTLGGVGMAHHFHSKNPEEDASRRVIDDTFTKEILWPNYHSGANGDFQLMHAQGEIHDIIRDPAHPDRAIQYLPAHPHEGAVSAPPHDPSARVVATGRSKVSGKAFNLIVAFEATVESGRAVAQSTFHHFTDYNWDISRGAPSFVTEPEGNGMATNPTALDSTKNYMRNLSRWLSQ